MVTCHLPRSLAVGLRGLLGELLQPTRNTTASKVNVVNRPKDNMESFQEDGVELASLSYSVLSFMKCDEEQYGFKKQTNGFPCSENDRRADRICQTFGGWGRGSKGIRHEK